MPVLVLPFPVINPILFQWGPLAIRWYALAYVVGLVVGWWLIRRIVAADSLWGGVKRPTPDSIDDLLVYCALGVIVGGRLGNVLFYDPSYYLARPLEIFEVWRGGMAFHGGLIGAALGAWLFARRYRAAGADRLRSCLAGRADRHLPRPAGRISSSRSCGDGRPTCRGRSSSPAPTACRATRARSTRACSKAWRSSSSLSIAARLGAFRRPGLLAGGFGVLYGAARIFCEFFRDPDPRLEDLGGGLTMGMLLSAPLIVIGAALIGWSLRTKTAAGGSA